MNSEAFSNVKNKKLFNEKYLKKTIKKMNKKLTILTLLVFTYNLQADNGCNLKPAYPTIISKEVNTVNGSLTFNCYIKTLDSFYFSPWLVLEPTKYNLAVFA